MISEAMLATAVERGVLTADQADKLRALASEPDAKTAEPEDEERLRFISGFGDIFVALGIALFLLPLGYFAGLVLPPAVGWLAIAIASWGLAEFFTRRKRMSLPSIVLLGTFAAPLYMAAWTLMMGVVLLLSKNSATAEADGTGYAVAIAGAITAAGVALHYRRFRVPISVAAGSAALIVTAVGVMMAIVGPDLVWLFLQLILFLFGLGVFALAMRFDMSDPQRVTRRTDIAFWLHLLAAPLVVHPVIATMLKSNSPTPAGAVATLMIFAALAVVAVLINRRAILVSGLTYAGIAFGALVRQTGLGDMVGPFTFLALGAFVLILSAGWHTLRDALLSRLPSAIPRHLPASTVTPT